MSKQTTVEWLEEKLDIILELYASEWDKISDVLKQAKQMEKEQIIMEECICKTEISDEEIRKAFTIETLTQTTIYEGEIRGAIWYREQLKQRQ